LDFFLSIIIPAYNEQRCVGNTLDKILDYFRNKKYFIEIICVNDGSNDSTLNIIERHKEANLENLNNINLKIINNENNSGKGYSVRIGGLASTGEYVLFTDADLSTPIEEFDRLFNFIKDGYNITIGSRDLPGSNIIKRQAIIREYMGKCFNLLVRKIMNFKYRDTQCGFKLFDRKSVNNIFPELKINDFSFDVEILYLAEKLGLKVKEVPITWNNSKDSKVRIIRDSFRMLLSLLKIKRKHKKI